MYFVGENLRLRERDERVTLKLAEELVIYLVTIGSEEVDAAEVYRHERGQYTLRFIRIVVRNW